MQLDNLAQWVGPVPATMPDDMHEMAQSIVDEFTRTARRLLELGLGYLTLDRAGSTLSTGERQRIQLARAVRSELTGAMYVLDEPSIGLHPANVDGLLGVMRDLKAQGNTVVVVDHDTRVLRDTDWIIEMGPGAGHMAAAVIAQGTVSDIEGNPHSLIAPFLASERLQIVRPQTPANKVFDEGALEIKTAPLHTVHALDARVPKHRLTVVTGVSGSGKTTLVLESLVPALTAKIAGERLPEHVRALDAPGIDRVTMIDATPIGANVRSTVATYTGVLDDLRRLLRAPMRQGAWTQGGRVLVQHRLAALPLPATAPGRSHSTCSSCPTWTSTARTATAHATAMSQARSPDAEERAQAGVAAGSARDDGGRGARHLRRYRRRGAAPNSTHCTSSASGT